MATEKEEKTYLINQGDLIAVMTRWSSFPETAYAGMLVGVDGRGIKMVLLGERGLSEAYMLIPWRNIDGIYSAPDVEALGEWCKKAVRLREQTRLDYITRMHLHSDDDGE